MSERGFWEVKTLAEMSQAEWEALCDGCGKCCVVLLEDDETDEIWETDVACRLFDATCRRCRDYENRQQKVPGCVPLSPQNIGALKWMPSSCAYKRLSEGRGLAPWHPLVSGRAQSVVEAGIAVADDLDSEADVPEAALEMRVCARRWPD